MAVKISSNFDPGRPGSPDGSPEAIARPGASSARSLLLTVLGEWVLPAGGVAWTSTLLEALGVLGVEEAAARQALARTSARGLIGAERVGRRTRWALRPAARRLLEEGAERIYGFGRAPAEWDRQWVLVLVSVPEQDRHLRARLRTRLGWLGFGALGAGAWVCPWREREEATAAVLAEVGLAGRSTLWVGRPSDPAALAGRVGEIWALDAVADEYRCFVADLAGLRPEGPTGSFAALTLLVQRWRYFPSVDPALPAELLPPAWPGPAAAEAFHVAHTAWRPAATRWWEEHSES